MNDQIEPAGWSLGDVVSVADAEQIANGLGLTREPDFERAVPIPANTHRGAPQGYPPQWLDEVEREPGGLDGDQSLVADGAGVGMSQTQDSAIGYGGGHTKRPAAERVDTAKHECLQILYRDPHGQIADAQQN
jgi:hypothetical protein